MTSAEFVIWFKGFTEACNDYHPTPKQWDRIKEVLDEVEDEPVYSPLTETNPPYTIPSTPPYWAGDPLGWTQFPGTISVPTSGTIHTSGSSVTFSITDGVTSTTSVVWNDKIGCWHYTNYPEGFGYYTNTTLGAPVPEETKKQLLD